MGEQKTRFVMISIFIVILLIFTINTTSNFLSEDLHKKLFYSSDELSKHYYQQGLYFNDLDDVEQSKVYLEKSIYVKPNYKEPYLRLLIINFQKKYDYQEAIEVSELYIDQFPQDSLGYIFKSLTFMRNKETQKSIEQLLLTKNKDNVPQDIYFLILGMNYFELNNSIKGKEYFSKSLSTKNITQISNKTFLHNTKLDEIFYTLMHEKEYDYAEKLIWNITEFPDSYNLGTLDHDDQIRFGEFVARIKIYTNKLNNTEEVLINLTKNYQNKIPASLGCTYQALAFYYTYTNQSNKATEYFINAAELEPHKSYSQYEAAMACFRSNDYSCAKKYIDKALKLESSTGYLDLKGFTSLMLGNISSSYIIFKKNIEETDSIVAKSGMGHYYVTIKDYESAKDIFDEIYNQSIILMKNPDYQGSYIYSMTLLGLGWMNANQNLHENAIYYYDIILLQIPDHFFAQISKGNSLNYLSKFDEAQEIFSNLLEQYPNNKFVIAELGLLELSKGNFSESEKLFNKSLNLDNTSYTCPYEGLGLLYYSQNKTNLAKKNLEKSIQINPDIEYLKYNVLAKIYIEEKNYDKARQLLKKSIENYPYDNEATLLLENLPFSN